MQYWCSRLNFVAFWMIAKSGENYGYHVHGEEICGYELQWAIVGMFHYWIVSISVALIFGRSLSYSDCGSLH